MFNKQTIVVKIFWDSENINKLLYGGGILYVIYSIQIFYYFPCPDTNGSLIHNFAPIYQWENFNEILIIKANIMVNIFILQNWSQIAHIEDHLMFYNSKLSKVSGY